MAEQMTDTEIVAFLSHGTRTGKLAWTGPSGQAHVAPVWLVVDESAPVLEVVFNPAADSAKGRALRRDPRVSLLVDDEQPPFAFVKLTGRVTLGDDPDELRTWAARIGGRYMGADRAAEFGRRNGVPGELLVRLRPDRVIAARGVAD
jgi:PPOX class probable F420-dependent enzyme